MLLCSLDKIVKHNHRVTDHLQVPGVKNNIEVDIQLLGLLEPEAETDAKYKIEPES